MSKQARGQETGGDDTRLSSRSRSREREVDQSPRQLRSHTRATAALQVAYANNPHSISRLHDDELSCLLPFLSLPDLAQLVRCSRRFNAVARKERSRGLHLETATNVSPLPSSVLIHHVASLRLLCLRASNLFGGQTLRHLKECPHLTALHLSLSKINGGTALLEGQSQVQATEALKAVLPTQLTSFGVFFGGDANSTGELCSTFCAALRVMPQLTNLLIHLNVVMDLPPGVLTQLPRLRKIRFSRIHWTSVLLAELKQLSELRELSIQELLPFQIFGLCRPPHSVQLEHIEFSGKSLEGTGMRALLNLPTLTSLTANMSSDAWPLLPQLPLLRRLAFSSTDQLTVELTAVLSASLSQCKALNELTLESIRFDESLLPEQIQVLWTDSLRSMPNVRRFHVERLRLPLLLAVLPMHLPLLSHLSLSDGQHRFGLRDESAFADWALLAHPTVRHLELCRLGLSGASHGAPSGVVLARAQIFRCMRACIAA